MRLVVDTNVLVSALLKPGSVPDRALEAIWSRSATVLFDARIADEYRTVLARPKFGQIERQRVDEVLGRLFSRGHDVGVVATWAGELGDEGDRVFVEVALAGRVEAIVTGNIKHYPLGLGFEVLPPASLLALLEPGLRGEP